jgi:fructosamine-3-kinase
MKITFQNEPKLSEHDADKDFNAQRVALAGQLKKFIGAHNRFRGKDVSITFAHKGVSSLIAIIETVEEKVVLKIPLSTTYAQGEAQFLKMWERIGVKVPHVIEEGFLDGHTYTLMEFIDAPILTAAYAQEELVEKGIYREMGKMLRLMHTPHAAGYGRVIEEKAEYAQFSDWLLSEDIKIKITYVKDHSLLDNEHGSIATAFEVLQEYAKGQSSSSYCHDDFGGANIFATNPMTVFDPNPRFNYGYIDLGRSMVKHLSEGISPAQLLEGYFGEAESNQRVLHAAILLNAYMKFPYWHKIKKTQQIQRVRKYLVEGRKILE